MDTPATADPPILPQPSNTPDSPKRPVVPSWLAVLLILTVCVSTLVNAWLILSIARQERDREIADETAKQLENARSQLSAVQGDIERLNRQKAELADFVASWARRKGELDAGEAAFAVHKEERDQLEIAVKSLTGSRDLCNRQVTELNLKRAELASTLENLRADNNDLALKKQGLPTIVAQTLDAERRRSDAETHLKLLQGDIASAQQLLDQTHSSLEKRVADLGKQRDDLKDEITRLQTPAADLRDRQKSLQAADENLATLRLKIAAAEVQAQQAEDRSAKARAEIKGFEGQLAQARQDAKDLDVRRDQGKAAVDEHERRLTELRQHLTEIQIQLAADQERQRRLTSELNGVPERLKAKEEEISQLEDRRNKALIDSQNDEARSAAALMLERESKARLALLESDWRDLTRKVESLKKEETALENDIHPIAVQQPQQPPATK